MDLSNPFAAIAPTLDAGVLQVLAATTAPMTAAEVHRRMDRGSDEGVRRVLGRLVRQGIVERESPARYPLYRLNRDHVAAPLIVSLGLLRSSVFDRIKDAIEAWEVRPRHASLFGSFARGEADEESDIDVLVVRPSGLQGARLQQWVEQVDRFAQGLRRATGNTVQVLDPTPATLSTMLSRQDPLLDEWRADAVHVSGERLLDLLRSLR